MTRVAIFEAGTPPQAVLDKFGALPGMFERLLADPEIQFTTYRVEDRLPPLDAFDAGVITGSAAGVYNSLPWIKLMKDMVLRMGENGLPLFAVCFGHQLTGDAYGGEGTTQLTRKPHVGLRTYNMTPEGKEFFGGLDTMIVPPICQDQVLKLPPNATLLADGPDCPFAALAYRKNGKIVAITIQPHPELSVDTARALAINWAQSNPGYKSAIEAQMASYDQLQPNAAKLAPHIKRFLKRELMPA